MTQTPEPTLSHTEALTLAIDMLTAIRDGKQFETLDYLTKLGQIELSLAQPLGVAAIPAEWDEDTTNEVCDGILDCLSDYGRRERLESEVANWTRQDWLSELEMQNEE